MNLAFYGSLKRGAYNHKRFGMDSLPLIGTGMVRGAMYQMFTYPVLVAPEQAVAEDVRDHVVEVYDVPEALAGSIDRMERGAGYESKELDITLDTGETVKASVYFYTGPTSHLKLLEEYSAVTVPEAYAA